MKNSNENFTISNETNSVDNNEVVLQYGISNDCDVNNVKSTADDDVMHSSTGVIENMIPVKVAKLQTRALCDMGASINVMGQAFMSQIPKKFMKKLPNKFTAVHGIRHHQQKINCRIQLDLEINGMCFTQPPVILCGTQELGWAPFTHGCWQVNSILTNIGHRNSIWILNQYPFWWKILIRAEIFSFIKFSSFYKLRLS